MARGTVRGEGAFKAVIGIAILVVTIVASIKIIPLHVHGGEVLDAMNEQANFASIKSLERIRDEVWHTAQEAQVPLPKDDIKVTRSGNVVTIHATYSQSVDVFGYKYVYNFDKQVDKPVF